MFASTTDKPRAVRLSRVIDCPGCGVSLPPDPAAPPSTHLNTSAECRQVYGEIVSYTALNQVQLGVWHEICVDAYRARHIGPETAPLGITFALNGLYLVYERGFTGLQAREAHSYLANQFDEWPRFEPPAKVGDVTAFEVALASDPDEHIDVLRRWGRSVWDAWEYAHDAVGELTDRQLNGWRPDSR